MRVRFLFSTSANEEEIVMGVQGRNPGSIKRAVNKKAKTWRNAQTAEARLVAALARDDNSCIRDCPMERRPLDSLVLSGRDIYKSDTDQLRRWVEFGHRYRFFPPILVREHVIVWGEDIFAAAQRLELPDLPCLIADHLTDTEIGMVKIALHQQVTLRDVDQSVLRVILDEIEPVDLDCTFLSTAEIDVILLDDSGISPGPVPGPPKMAVSKAGDVFILGANRVHCGDATQQASYQALMGGTAACASVTDIPYNIPIAGNVSGLGKVKHGEFIMGTGEWTEEEFSSFMVTVFTLMRQYCIEGAAIGSFIDWRSVDLLVSAGKGIGLTLANMAIWIKSPGMGTFLRSAHELYPIFCNGPQLAHNNVMLGAYGRNRSNVWCYPSANQQGSSANKALASHPTPKNLEMIMDHILDISPRGGVILDPFLGSGTTLIAAEKTGRRCFGLELDPKYVDVTIARWEQLTGSEAIHEETGLGFAALRKQRATGDPADNSEG